MKIVDFTRALILRLILGNATTTELATIPGEIATTVTLPRPLTFGFEFTMDGIITSASLPNSTTVPLGVTRGSQAYRAEMSRLYNICEETARTSILPQTAKDYLNSSNASNEYPYIWTGGPVTELRDTILKAKRAALRTLVNVHGLRNLDRNAKYHALGTAPQFIFTCQKPSSAKSPFAAWERRVPEPDRDLNDHLLEKAWLRLMTTQFSQAVVEAGFHRVTIPYNFPWRNHTVYSHMGYKSMYDDFQFMHPAASHSICAAGIYGSCYLHVWRNDFVFLRNGHDRCQTRIYPEYGGNVALAANLQTSDLSLWAEGLGSCRLGAVPWNTWPQLKPPSKDDTAAWSEQVQLKISQLLEDTAKNASLRGVRLVPTGSAWTPALIDTLRNNSIFYLHEVPYPEYAASLNAARTARWEERSLSNAFVRPHAYPWTTGWMPFFERGHIRMWPRYEEELTWLVGGYCESHSECEQDCKWNGKWPTCHQENFVCQCGEFWREFLETTGRGLFQRIWEAKRGSLERVSGMCAAEARDTCGSSSVRRWRECKSCEENA